MHTTTACVQEERDEVVLHSAHTHIPANVCNTYNIVLRAGEKIFVHYVINYVKINFNLTGLNEKYRFATLIQCTSYTYSPYVPYQTPNLLFSFSFVIPKYILM